MTTALQSHDLQEFGLCNLVQGERTTFLQGHDLQELGLCNLVRAEYTTEEKVEETEAGRDQFRYKKQNLTKGVRKNLV